MSDWPRIPLGDIFEIARGGSPRPIDAYITDADDGINWISIADASDSSKYIERTKRRIRPEGASRSRSVVPGDLLLTNSMSFGRPYIMRTTGCIHDGWLVLAKKRDGIDQDFFYRLLGSEKVYAAFARLAAGATVKNLNIDLVKGVSVPVPPLPEQRRIAAILDQADALRAKRREALARLDSLTQSIFIEMFGSNDQSPVTVGERLTIHPQGWTWDLLTDVARLATGHTPDRKREDYWGGEVPWITLTEIRQFDGKTASTTKEMITEAGLQNSSAVLLPTGTVCFSRTASIGFVTVMGRPMATSQDFVNWVCGERIHPTYLMHAFLQSRSRLRSLSTGSTHKTIYFPTVEQFRVLVPPLDMQKRFAIRIQAVESLKATHCAALAELEALFASLQHRAFAGQLS